ncbi:MAG: hypothetical protein WCS01_10855 [bacterium]
MISFLTSLKPFRGAVADIQHAALRSWRQVHADAEIIVYGACPGIEVVTECKIRHVPNIACGASGPPLFNALADHAAMEARHDLQIYINGDILLHRCTLDAATALRRRFDNFLGVGQRVDLAEGCCVNMSAPDAGDELRRLAASSQATLHAPSGKDYFLFLRGLWQNLPAPVVLGRGAYDSALLAYAFRHRVPLVDCTAAIPALHLFHDYAHVAGGVSAAHHGPETVAMMRAYGVRRSAPTVADAGWVVVDGAMRRQPCRGDRLRQFELYLRFIRSAPRCALAVRALWRLLHPETRQPECWQLADICRALDGTGCNCATGCAEGAFA